MKRSRLAVVGATAALVAFALLYDSCGGGTVPHGQQPLVSLNSSNLSTLEDPFNQSAKSVRLLVMFSPT